MAILKRGLAPAVQGGGGKAVAQCDSCDAFVCQACKKTHDDMERFFRFHRVSILCSSSIIHVGPISLTAPNLN